MQVEREIVEFPGPNGANHVGILWQPPPGVAERKVLFILSHGGLVHKVGAHRAQNQQARFFSSRGCSVFRFDPAGMGDSDGTVPDQANQDLFGRIERGLFKDSYRGAFQYLESRFGDYSWIVSGVCGGAISSLLSGVESPHRIAGYALISCPVVLDGTCFDYARRAVPAIALKQLRMYASKITNPRAIWRFLTFQSEYSQMWTFILSLLLRQRDKVAAKFTRSGTPKAKEPRPVVSPTQKSPIGLSPAFIKAARQAMRKSEVLFLYGNNDGFLWEFTDLYAAAHLSRVQQDEVLRIIPHANHMFIWPEWQQQAFEAIDEWITSKVLRS